MLHGSQGGKAWWGDQLGLRGPGGAGQYVLLPTSGHLALYTGSPLPRL